MTDPELDGEDELPEEDDAPSAVSFFADGNDADERVCDAVWRMFVRHSNGNGIDARAKNHRALSATLARKRENAGVRVQEPTFISDTEPKEDEMGREKGSDGLTDKQRAVLDAWTSLKSEKGDDFNNEDVAKRAGIKGGSATSRSANVSTVLRRLRAVGLVTGEAPPRSPRRAPVAPTVPSAKPKRNPQTATVARRAPPRAAGAPDSAGGGSALAQLTARRDAMLADAAKLTAAIEVLQASG